MNEKPSFLDFNKSQTIVPRMENKVGNSYVETRTEVETRRRAEAESLLQIQKEAEIQAQEILAAQKPKKNTGLVVLAILMSFLAVAGISAAAALYFLWQEDESIISEFSE